MASTIVPTHLLGRLYFLLAIIAFEYTICIAGQDTILRNLNLFGSVIDTGVQMPVFAFLVFLGFGHRKLKAITKEIPFSCNLFAGHLLCIIAVLFLNVLQAQNGVLWLFLDPSSNRRCTLYLLGTVLLTMACVPLRSWGTAIRTTGRLWLYASLAGMTAWFSAPRIALLWRTTDTIQSGMMPRSTFYAVSVLLGPFFPDLIVDPSALMIGTPQCLITIAASCSGVEGFGLILIFTSFWLWYFRRDIRFPQALLLIPCALGCSWLLNILRLAALILIGSVCSPEVAIVGFHAHAGWIAFIFIAIFFSMAVLKIPWLRKVPSAVTCTAGNAPGSEINTEVKATAALSGQHRESPEIQGYLVPFLAILVVSFVSKAASGNFEWLYPLRPIAAAITIWYFWPELKKLNWRFGWASPLAGAVVFLAWIAPTLWSHHFAASQLGPSLAGLPPAGRWTWIAFRAVAAVVTVPIVEELAFRGYLARRFMSREFDRVPFTDLTALSIALSSVVFGLMHGQKWGVGILAGLVYAFVLRWRGRIGDAVVAHAVSNLLLAIWVLSFGDWAQW